MQEEEAGKRELKIKNPRINHNNEDILYHLALGNKSHDLVQMFSDVKFVCMGGTPQRMEKFAYYVQEQIGLKLCPGTMLQDLSAKSNRYAMYKVGPIISVSHGMGMPSISILLHELIKLMFHAGVKSPLFIRLGTCGGIGLDPGSVIVTSEALNGALKPCHRWEILGKIVERPTYFCPIVADMILNTRDPSDHFKIIKGKTVSTDDFYEGQGRLDGAFCDFDEDDKFAFLKRCQEMGVTNFEMEAAALAAITHHVGISAACICVTLLDRLNGDQVNQSKEKLLEFQDRPMIVLARFIKKYLKDHPDIMGQPQDFRVSVCPKSGSEKKQDTPLKSREKSNYSCTHNGQIIPARTCPRGCSIIVSDSQSLRHTLDESEGVE